jgi:hypothetical protein
MIVRDTDGVRVERFENCAIAASPEYIVRRLFFASRAFGS